VDCGVYAGSGRFEYLENQIGESVEPYQTLQDKKVSVLGLGISGLEAALFLKKKGADIFVSELISNQTVLEYRARLEKNGIEVELGKHSMDRIVRSDLVVISPGIKPSTEIYRAVQEAKKARLISEIELASWFAPCEIIAVTGTNGKTTTTSLIAGLFNHFGMHSIACGNIGNPFIAEIEHLRSDSKAVVEVSSFQLENTWHFRARVALLLNVTPDHFDWHGDMHAYLHAKAKIFKNQTRQDFAILNRQDQLTQEILSLIPSKVVYFNEGGIENPNWDAVLKAADIYDLDRGRVLNFLSNFQGIEHRMEKVPSGDGLFYINDSKSTNPSSLEWALARMKEPAILICGGRNKGNNFRPLASLVQKKVKVCVVFGESSFEMSEAWKDVVPVRVCRDLMEAVHQARASARPGDTILLSPACASFDQFVNYKQRGERFKEIIAKLAFQSVLQVR